MTIQGIYIGTEKCKGCGVYNGTKELHPCPYYCEVYDDDTPRCNCCKDCVSDCADDI